MTRESGGYLAICATPIGNMGDISQRILDELEAADAIYAEDTRVTRKLLARFGISTQVRRCDENVTNRMIPQMIEEISGGAKIAFVSDAGTPCISDPGQRVVAAVREAGLDVTVIPGPNAALTALAGSGFSCKSFFFGGFLPRKAGERERTLRSLESLDAALIFYESNHRTYDALKTIAQVFPERRVCMARELTKLHEEYLIGSTQEVAASLADRAESLKGEVTIVIEPPARGGKAADAGDLRGQIAARAEELLAEGNAKPSEIAKALALEFGIAKGEAYDIVQELKDSSE
ncbi:MAG: 16S rRNA (cytidine(1402)-2'-O)-methyltransferase [bacterium]|nr:16S rRNA (cytidine(1402)-2'-O)-methyltransferase [bacterium]